MDIENLNPSPDESHRITTTGDIEVSTYLEIAKGHSGAKPAALKKSIPGAEREAIIVLDFGSQYNMLIARRVREAQVYCELVPHDTPWEKIAPLNPKGFILSGGPASVYDKDAPLAPSYVYEKGLPVLGICYGMDAIAKQLGVATGTLCNWSREHQHQVQNLRAIEWEEFLDRTLVPKEERVKARNDQLARLQTELASPSWPTTGSRSRP